MDKQVSWNRSAHDDFDFYSSIVICTPCIDFFKKKKKNKHER